jgi:hypothetical protein
MVGRFDRFLMVGGCVVESQKCRRATMLEYRYGTKEEEAGTAEEMNIQVAHLKVDITAFTN